ncbi:hypothetical protein C5Y93_01820 [Blastopirellula marina]|uniref:Uncharacterized protein n=1 Tax=Blastopirellula marina TaxID=124 RepID=A0A2S8GUS8_9BACT|nr:hypothetical protein C5Y93_01820 [Blastopirellula marina]
MGPAPTITILAGVSTAMGRNFIERFISGDSLANDSLHAAYWTNYREDSAGALRPTAAAGHSLDFQEENGNNAC